MKKSLILLVAVMCFAIPSWLLFSGNDGGIVSHILRNHTFEEETTEEIINTALINTNSEQLILLGKEHYYFLRTAPEVYGIFNWLDTLPKEIRTKAKVEFFDNEVGKDHRLEEAYFLISIDNTKRDLAPEIVTHLLNMGFKYGGNNGADYTSTLLYEALYFDGTGYSVDEIKLPVTAMPLNQKHAITLHNYPSPGVRRILLTPLAIATDIVTSPIQGVFFLFAAVTYGISG